MKSVWTLTPTHPCPAQVIAENNNSLNITKSDFISEKCNDVMAILRDENPKESMIFTALKLYQVRDYWIIPESY